MWITTATWSNDGNAWHVMPIADVRVYAKTRVGLINRQGEVWVDSSCLRSAVYLPSVAEPPEVLPSSAPGAIPWLVLHRRIAGARLRALTAL